jgi:hypothetical protein
VVVKLVIRGTRRGDRKWLESIEWQSGVVEEVVDSCGSVNQVGGGQIGD